MSGDFVDDTLNVVTQLGTWGSVGFEDGGFKKGVITDATIDVTKELTGAAAAEDANAVAREQFEQQKAAAAKERKEAKAQSAQEQITASRLAGGARAGKSTSKSSASRFSSLGGDEQDFLGL